MSTEKEVQASDPKSVADATVGGALPAARTPLQQQHFSELSGEKLLLLDTLQNATRTDAEKDKI